MSDARQRIRDRLQTLGLANAIAAKLVNAAERYCPAFALPVVALALAAVHASITAETIACVERFNALSNKAPAITTPPRRTPDYSLN